MCVRSLYTSFLELAHDGYAILYMCTGFVPMPSLCTVSGSFTVPWQPTVAAAGSSASIARTFTFLMLSSAWSPHTLLGVSVQKYGAGMPAGDSQSHLHSHHNLIGDTVRRWRWLLAGCAGCRTSLGWLALKVLSLHCGNDSVTVRLLIKVLQTDCQRFPLTFCYYQPTREDGCTAHPGCIHTVYLL